MFHKRYGFCYVTYYADKAERHVQAYDSSPIATMDSSTSQPLVDEDMEIAKKLKEIEELRLRKSAKEITTARSAPSHVDVGSANSYSNSGMFVLYFPINTDPFIGDQHSQAREPPFAIRKQTPPQNGLSPSRIHPSLRFPLSSRIDIINQGPATHIPSSITARDESGLESDSSDNSSSGIEVHPEENAWRKKVSLIVLLGFESRRKYLRFRVLLLWHDR